MSELPRLVLDPTPDAQGNAVIRPAGGSEHGDTGVEPIATVRMWGHADRIVTAANAHRKLVDAVRVYVDWIDRHGDCTSANIPDQINYALRESLIGVCPVTVPQMAAVLEKLLKETGVLVKAAESRLASLPKYSDEQLERLNSVEAEAHWLLKQHKAFKE